MIIFNEAKPKYEKLDELLDAPLHNIRYSKQVNVIVDLKEITRKFFRPDIEPVNSGRQLIEEIASDIINIISHYRNYFFKNSKYTSFFFMYSYNKCEELIKVYPSYKKEYYEKYLDLEDNAKGKVINKAIQVVEKVVNGIPHAYFIDTSKFDELLCTKYLLTNIKPNEYTLILTNDSMFYQLLDENINILSLKGIKSELITKENAVNILTKKDDYKFSSALIPLVLALSGNKRYGFDGITNMALIKSANMVQMLLDRGLIIDAPSIKVPIEFAKLDPKNKFDQRLIENAKLISTNYENITLDNMLYNNKLLLMNICELTEKHSLISFFQELNAKFFSMHPLQLDMMLKGEKL